jgi:gamma-glutamylcysteine synthetase
MPESYREFSPFGAKAAASEALDDFRARVLKQQEDRAAQRQHDLTEQSSTLNSPETRIRIWEQLHAVRLPRQPNSQLIAVVASGTGLTVDQINAEVLQRLTPRTATVGN